MELPENFDIGNKWYLVLKQDTLKLFEDGTNKKAKFSYSRWAMFVEQFYEIDNSVDKLLKQSDVALKLHISGGWHVSVTKGYTGSWTWKNFTLFLTFK